MSGSGAPVRRAATLARIRALAIPPAWSSVWICPSPHGHIQATGRDARGRKQYRYHARFREIREENKYAHVLAFAAALPEIRARVDVHLSLPGLERDKVLATVVRLLEITLIRVGNEEYARDNGSFGLTTLRSRHVDVRGSKLLFRFRGKSKKDHVVTVEDRRLARIVQRCHDLPGQILFQYLDDESVRRTVEADDVNAYIRSIAGDFTAKDFRTWAGTVLVACALAARTTRDGQRTKRDIVAAVREVSARLGNTPAVCRRCYVHPTIFDLFLEGRLDHPSPRPVEDTSLSAVEGWVLTLLRDHPTAGAVMASDIGPGLRRAAA